MIEEIKEILIEVYRRGLNTATLHLNTGDGDFIDSKTKQITNLFPKSDKDGLVGLPTSRDEGDIEAETYIKGFDDGRKAQQALTIKLGGERYERGYKVGADAQKALDRIKHKEEIAEIFLKFDELVESAEKHGTWIFISGLKALKKKHNI